MPAKKSAAKTAPKAAPTPPEPETAEPDSPGPVEDPRESGKPEPALDPEREAAIDQQVQALLPQYIHRTAITTHMANMGFCQGIGDRSQVTWENAEEWQRQSALKGAELVLTNPVVTPRELHESWLREKEATGWTYGPVKDPVRKQHPCFVPYDALPYQQQTKDALFRAIGLVFYGEMLREARRLVEAARA